jgi:hypothetical protein
MKVILYICKKIDMKILGFQKYNDITSARFRVKSVEKLSDEICYHVLLSINGEKINGEIFCESNGDLECYQFYNSNGVCITELYGQDIIEELIRKKLKKLK